MTAPALEYDVQAISSRVMYELLGRRWVWPRLRVVDVHLIAPDIYLSGRPVTEVISVTGPDGVQLAPQSWELSSNARLRLPASFVRYWMPSNMPQHGLIQGYPYASGPCSAAEVKVEYVYGSRPPEQVRYATDLLAKELEQAAIGGDCNLPKRVTNISRQGLSMALLDPQDFLDKGKTGVPEIDLAISVFNRGNARMRARVFTDKMPPPRRLSTVEVEETIEAKGSNFTIIQGQDWSATWPVYEDDGVTPIDLTAGWSITGQVRPYPGSSTLLYEWKAAAGNVTLGVGSFTLSVPDQDSAAWDWRRGSYQIEATSPGGVTTTRVEEGIIYVDPEVVT